MCLGRWDHDAGRAGPVAGLSAPAPAGRSAGDAAGHCQDDQTVDHVQTEDKLVRCRAGVAGVVDASASAAISIWTTVNPTTRAVIPMSGLGIQASAATTVVTIARRKIN
jgi:hypothetical protein